MENSKYDNNGAPVPETAPHYHHGHGFKPCPGDKSEDLFVIRFKWRYLKLAALVLAAFMLGAAVTNAKYARRMPAVQRNCVIFGGSEAAMPATAPYVQFEKPEIRVYDGYGRARSRYNGNYR